MDGPEGVGSADEIKKREKSEEKSGVGCKYCIMN